MSISIIYSGKWPLGGPTDPVGPSWAGSWPGLNLFPDPHKSMMTLPDSRCQCHPVLKTLVFRFPSLQLPEWMAISRADYIVCVTSTPGLRVGERNCPPKVPWHSQPRQGKDGQVGTEGVTKSPVLGKQKEVGSCVWAEASSPQRMLHFPHQTWLTEHKFTGKTKNFKAATTENESSSAGIFWVWSLWDL